MSLSCNCTHEHRVSLGASRILRAYGYAAKADDPTDPEDFVVMAEDFSEDLARTSAPIDEFAVKRAIELLDADWASMSVSQATAIILSVSRILAAAGIPVAEAVRRPTAVSMAELINSTAKAAGDKLPSRGSSTFGGGGTGGHGVSFTGRHPSRPPGVTATFDAQHPGIGGSVLRSQTSYVTDEYGRHASYFSSVARKIVANGLNAGLRADVITAELVDAATIAGIVKPREYWNVYSYATMNRARIYTQLVTFREAGFVNYRFVAVMDERTSDICRSLHGRVWAVASALRKFNQADMASGYTHDAVKDVLPWVRTRGIGDGDKEMFVRYRDGSEFQVGVISRSGVGTSDDAGEYRSMATSASLESAGVMMPPLHGRCRSSVEVDG
jgi:SPP1 gp7 family putative phage head morphogenesis protein